jgi:hypothetical protein
MEAKCDCPVCLTADEWAAISSLANVLYKEMLIQSTPESLRLAHAALIWMRDQPGSSAERSFRRSVEA